jgi:hypothetical protein
MSGTTTDFDWIESFRLANYRNISGESTGYELFDTIIQTLSAGETVDFSIEQGNNFQEAVRIWIDLNRDNDFNDLDEKVFEGILNFTDSISGLINIPANASPGVTRMRVALQWSTYPTLCTQYQNGETEDYCLRILPNTAVLNNDDLNNTFIYPNPTSDYIQIDNIPYDFTEIKILDITGKLLLYTKNNNNSINIKMPDNTVSGTYFIKLISKNKSIIKKLIYNKN